MKIKPIHFLLPAFLITIIACRKPTIIPPPVPTSSIHDSIQFNFQNRSQYFTFNGGSGGDFVTEKSVEFHIPYYAFRYENGDTVFSTIHVELVEIPEPQDMILVNKPSTADNQVINSGGHFKMEFSVNNNPVFLQDTMIYIKVPKTASNPNMYIFDGIVDATGYVNWIPSTDELGQYKSVLTASEIVNGVIQEYDSLILDETNANWISYGRFLDNSGSQTKLAYTLPELHDNSNTFYFLHFDNVNAVMAGYFDGYQFITPSTIPIGSNVTVVLISEIDNNYYSKFIDNTTIGSSSGQELTLDPTTYSDLINRIINL